MKTTITAYELKAAYTAYQMALIDEMDLYYTFKRGDYEEGYIADLKFAKNELTKIIETINKEK